MGKELLYKECLNCGNQELVSDYDYNTEELKEFCDVCGYYHSIILSNKIEGGNYHEDWKPEYDKKEGVTGYVIKIFEDGNKSYFLSIIEKKDLKEALQGLKNDILVYKFAVTFKNENGFYQTQIFDKSKGYKKFEIQHLNDVVSNNPEDYTLTDIIYANNQVDAVKKLVIKNINKDAIETIQFILDIQGDIENVLNELLALRFVVTKINQIK